MSFEENKNFQALLQADPPVSHLIRAITKSFLGAGIPSPQTEAEWLLASILQTNRSGLYQQAEPRFSSAQRQMLVEYHTHRLQREPLQYLLGTCAFFGYEFQVSPAVLIPRPETELLVEKVIALLQSKKKATIIDLGTGSGCIAISLARELPTAQVVATDISNAALEIAKHNATVHEVADRIRFLQADMCNASLWRELPQFDCVVSNPPYVLQEERAELQPEVRDYEPAAALYVEGDGLQFYQTITKFCEQHLKCGGYVACEMASQRSAAIAQLFHTSSFTSVEIIRDYSGFDRHVIGQKI
ncbi:peptide chain release factor N(5)-glutamine methyltransferase [candidate division KSB1 bacterium]|nr:peptide chain release factor N(5)-glutamine methyltransferase [candidate division KSB1 bacterium]